MADTKEIVCLPSGDSAKALVQGDARALPTVVLHWGVRSVLIGTGIALFTPIRGKQLVRASLAGSTAIEAFVVAWALWCK